MCPLKWNYPMSREDKGDGAGYQQACVRIPTLYLIK